MKNLKGCFMHESDDWKTPSYLYWWIVEKCGYYDPCPYKCKEFDGLTIEWPKNVYCNPPYSQITKWVEKAIEEHKKNYESHIVMLLPVRTDTKWFEKLQKHAVQIEFIKGRLHFNDSKTNAPFPSMLVSLYYGSEDTKAYVVNHDWLKKRYREYINGEIEDVE